ncbi:MAG: hypothetical protein RRC07_04280 [Anaerolineae bacterium]|nr:hypothetical protein [Anaerolineae bacterium]
MTEPARRGRPGREGPQQGWWRAMLVIGALGASLLGSELIASREAGRVDAPAATVITIPVPQADGTLAEEHLELAPVPTAVPRSEVATVARSRSSR